MPIRTQSDLPAKEILEQENIFVMDESRAMHQDIRPINIVILNLMPLKEETDEQMIKAVKDYYTEKKADTEFVEMYDHFKIYTKSGKYKDTYVAFVRYDMKIKDIYTEVPGLGTLYVKKDSQGNYQITQQVKKKEIREYINRIAEHEDVQALMNQTQESYQKAVGSDALLKEALDELKDAYENSIGN